MNGWLLAGLVLMVGTAAWGAEGEGPSDDDVRKLVYDRTYRVPRDFYKDHALADANYSLYFHQDDWYADDKDRARKIVQDFLDKPSAIDVKKIEEVKETPLSFDFRGGKIWYRVHKPAYFTFKGKRAAEPVFGAPASGEPVELGQFKAKQSLDSIRQFAEYYWQIQYYNLGGAKVIRSEGKELKDRFEHTLWTTNVVFGDFGLADQIEVVTFTYTVDRKDGKTTLARKAVKSLTGKRN